MAGVFIPGEYRVMENVLLSGRISANRLTVAENGLFNPDDHPVMCGENDIDFLPGFPESFGSAAGRGSH